MIVPQHLQRLCVNLCKVPLQHFCVNCHYNQYIFNNNNKLNNKKHLKNVGPIRHCEPPHVHSPDVASGTVARRLRIDVHDNDGNDNDNA